MTTYDYYSISLRIGILIVVLSCVAIANMVLSLSDVMDANLFKCVVASWSLFGLVGSDISKNGIRQWRRQVRLASEQAKSLLVQSEGVSGNTWNVIDPNEMS